MRRNSSLVLIGLWLGCLRDQGQAPSQPMPEDRLKGPVDMVFRAAVEVKQNNCRSTDLPTEKIVFVDVWPMVNGHYRVRVHDWQTYRFSAYSLLEVERKEDGWVTGVEPWTSGYTHQAFERRLSGWILPEAIDVTIESGSDYPDASCFYQVHLIGTPRGFSDPTAYDGTYRILMSGASGNAHICPGQKREFSSFPLHYFSMDVDEYKAGQMARIIIGWMAVDLKITSPTMDQSTLNHIWRHQDYQGLAETDGMVSGTFRPDKVDLTIEYGGNPDKDCVHSFHLTGAKLLPNTKEPNAEYRGFSEDQSSCGRIEEPLPERYEFIDQGDGWALWRDVQFGIMIELERKPGGILAGTAEEEEVLVKYLGAITPPTMTLTTTRTQKNKNAFCPQSVMKFDGEARFLP